ncbi:MAG: cadherin domain-containing protein [Dehalococcoidia bacterium]|nr:cadherin domain-containing protein [Dehalococcoidia bacterium]
MTNLNEGPEISGSNSITYTEGLLSVVGTYKHNDPEGENIVWNLGTILDEDDFTITNGELRFAEPPDVENPTDRNQDNVYYVLVKVTDGEFDDEFLVTVVVTDTNEVPTFPGANTSRDVSENTRAGQNVGAPVSASDPERDSLTYSLGGPDQGHFDISTSTGQILTKSDLDYEGSKKSYSVTVSVTDSKDANGVTEAIPTVDANFEVTINVIDEDEAPVLTGATSTSATENATGTITTYLATDPEGATTTFTVHGDSSDFSISDGGVLSIDATPDFEEQAVYQITVRASDAESGGNIADLNVTVNVTNVDEPGVVTLSPASPEDGFQVSASLTDPDLNVSGVSWSWARSTDKSGWQPISGQSGSGYTPVDADEGHYLRATATYDDREGTGKSADGISDSQVPAVNSRPSFSPNIVRKVNENTPSGVKIGDPVAAMNDETEDTLVYSLEGANADMFGFSTTTGQLYTKEPLNHEEASSYNIEISVSDGKDINDNAEDSVDATIPVTVNVKDVDEAPVISGDEVVSFNENATATVAIYTAVDPEGHSHSWDLSGTDSGAFDISGGNLTFKSPPDFEIKSTYQVTVVATDSRNPGTLDVTVNIVNMDEAGSVTLSSRQPQVEATLTATLSDPDKGISTLTWTWETATSSDWTEVRTATSSSGVTDSYTPVEGDVGKSIRVTVSYTDGHSSGKSATVTSANQAEEKPPTNFAPTFPPTTDTQLSVPENTSEGEDIGSPVTATDDNNDDLSYTLGGQDAASFDIDSSSGQLKTKAALDHEDKDTYTVTVTASDPSNEEATVTVTITVTDVNEPPSLSLSTTDLSYPENDDRPVATFTTSDPEDDDITLVPKGDDGKLFRFSGTELHFNALPNFETPLDTGEDNEYNIEIFADDKNSTTTLKVTITVTNVNEPPQFPNGDTGTRSVTENTTAGQNVGAPVSASDPEDKSLHYSLSGTDAGHFDIDDSTGQILAKSELDYEGRKSYSVTVSVRDSKNVDGQTDAVTDDEIDITINVIGENEAPVITGATSTNFAENGTRAVASYTGRDPEGGSVYWTVLGTDSAYFAITDSGVLSVDPAPDFEDPDDSDRNNVYHVTVQASDGNNINRLDMTVTVTNVEEPGEVELSSVQPQVDTALTATLDDPDGVESTITWSWQRSRAGSKSSWSTISGATSDSYIATSTDVGRYLRATATYDDGYSSGKSASAVSENTVRELPVNNDPPRFLSQFERRSVDENTAPGQNVGDPVTAIDDPADNLTYWLDGTNAGMFSIVRSTGQIQTRMPLDYESNSSYRVTVIAADPSNATTSVPVTITVVNVDEAPVAVADTATATEDGAAVTIDVLANDSDPEGMQLSLTAVMQPANSSTAIVGTNVEYTPSAGYYGSDSFTYTVSDVNSNSSVGNVTITVAADSDPTVQTDTIAIQFVPIDGGGERILLSDYFSDPDEGHPPYQATSSDATIFTVDVSEGYLTITPVGIGVATTTLTVSDTPGISQEFRVVVYRPVVARTNTEAVHIVDPDVETTLVSEDEVLSVLFQEGARDQFFQVAVDAQSNNCGIEAPIDHQHVCVLVDLFDLGAESIEESLNQNSTLDVTLDQMQYAAVAADVASGDFQMWKGHGPTDVSWDEMPQCPNPVGTDECYELTADQNGNGGMITVYNIAGFSEFAAGSDQPAPPPTEPPTTTPPPTTGGGGNTGGGSGTSGGGSSSGGSSSSSRYESSSNQTPQIFGQTNVTFNENGTDPVATYIAEDADDDDITWSLLGYDRSKFRLSQE